MIKFEVKSKILNVGERKGQQVYYAQPISQSKVTVETLKKRIERETSLTAGDVQNALTSMTHIICEALSEGRNVDLGELGYLRMVVPSKMMDKKEDVTVTKALKTPKIVFTPKQAMKDAAKSVSMAINKDSTGEGPAITAVCDLLSKTPNQVKRDSYTEVDGRGIMVLAKDGVSKGIIEMESELGVIETIQAASITINNPEKVIFKMVNELAEGKYILRFKTYYDEEEGVLEEERVIEYDTQITLI